ncbi:hypothetical protein GN157_06575 [Flavobacterium rakeshii]|uniref:Uncharacterized protein n=1 Tax=Flavobacterium rakeshii TaxID=1038845 RepID=A0A6N8HAA6_9FLAO|nr:hypothetical protein [Flavobacterium rakeshii]MUV03371.1 hypothetical protein [Flavobacterium rakeshii]
MTKPLLTLLLLLTLGFTGHAQQKITVAYIEQHYGGWYFLHPETEVEPQCRELEDSNYCINRQIKEFTGMIEQQVAAMPHDKLANWKQTCDDKVEQFIASVSDSPAKALMKKAYTRDVYKEFLLSLLGKIK